VSLMEAVVLNRRKCSRVRLLQFLFGNRLVCIWAETLLHSTGFWSKFCLPELSRFDIMLLNTCMNHVNSVSLKAAEWPETPSLWNTFSNTGWIARFN